MEYYAAFPGVLWGTLLQTQGSLGRNSQPMPQGVSQRDPKIKKASLYRRMHAPIW